MRVAVIGTGYVGLVTGTCLAEVGHQVICMDTVEAKISALKAGRVPIYEDGLEEMVVRNSSAGRLRFTTDLRDALETAEVVFLAIGTPPGEDGAADLSMILQAAESIGELMDHELILVQKSTCPVGTVQKIEERVGHALARRGVQIPFAVVSNPEFLREGSAVRDFLEPGRVIVGAASGAIAKHVASLYSDIAPPERILLMDVASAELTKYAANAFLAMKISFINEIANLCELVGADIVNVRHGIGLDSRIGAAFLGAGIGYGGSCFPKDVKALVHTSRENGYSLRIMEAVEVVNQEQWERQVEKIIRFFGGSLAGRRLAILGVAFKPGTDDIRESPAIASINKILARGADVATYDPAALGNAEEVLGSRVRYATDALSCVEGADAAVLMTEWSEFLRLDLVQLGARMKQMVLFDFRNGFTPTQAEEAGFTYFGVGRAVDNNTPAVAPGIAD